MLHPGLRLGIRVVSWLLEHSAILALAWIGYALDITDDVSFLSTAISYTRANAAVGIALATAIVVMSRVTRWFVREAPTSTKVVADCIREALDRFRSECFPTLPEKTPRDDNRASIFQHVQWKWWVWPWRCPFWPWGWRRFPGSGWLSLVHRSGHTTQLSATVFLAPDDAPKAEGVAGRAWRGDGAVRVRQLPNINDVQYVSWARATWYNLMAGVGGNRDRLISYRETQIRIQQYAKATNTPARAVWQRIRMGKRNPVSILALPLESRDNRRWGVLVLDSSNEVECIDTEDRRFRIALTKLKNSLDRYAVTR